MSAGVGPGRHPVVDLPGCVRGPPRAVGTQLDAADPRHVPQEPVASAGKSERHRDLGIALDEVDDGPFLVQQAVLVLTEPVEALRRVGVERDFTAVEVASAPTVTPLGGRREMGNALAEQLLGRPARRKRIRGGKGTNRSSWLSYTSTTRSPFRTRARSSAISTWAVAGSGLAQGAAGRLCHGRSESRAHSNAALPPRVDLEDLAALAAR